MLLSDYNIVILDPKSRPITKEEIKAACKIMEKATGDFSFWNRARNLASLNVRIPGLGIPISEDLAEKCLLEMEKTYDKLPKGQQHIIAKCAKWLHGIVD